MARLDNLLQAGAVTKPAPQVWQLVTHGGEAVAMLEVVETDMFWVQARVIPGAMFDQHASLFAEEVAASDAAAETDDWSRSDELYQEIRERFALRAPDGRYVPEFLLHIDGHHASWRYSDEPFDA